MPKNYLAVIHHFRFCNQKNRNILMNLAMNLIWVIMQKSAYFSTLNFIHRATNSPFITGMIIEQTTQAKTFGTD